MNKKTLSRIAALSIAAASAVSTLGMTASADVVIVNSTEAYVTELWELRVPNGNGYTLTYYTTEAQANAAVSSLTGTVSRVSTSALLSVNDKFSITNGVVTKVANGEYTYKGSSYNGGSVTSVGEMSNITYRYSSDYRWYSHASSRYYPSYYAMLQVEPNIGSNYTSDLVPEGYKWSTTQRYFDYNLGRYTLNNTINTIEITNYGGNYTGSYNISTSYRTSSTTVYYYGGVYYPNYNNMVASLGFTPSTGTYSTKSLSSSDAYSSSRPYFDPHYGVYRSSTSGYSDLVLINAGTGSYTVYYSTYTQKYYDSYTEARNATPSGYSVSDPISSYYSASTLNTYGYSPYYYNGYYYNGNYYNGYYYNGYYYNGYYPWNYTTTTTTNDTSTVTIGKYKGWTNVIRYINASRSGASYDVNMKSETEIPSNVLKALKGKNVTLNLKFNSGAVLAVNGNDITSTDALTVNIKYDKNVPSSLAKKAVKANSGVASAQFSISGGSLGASASVTIKFSTSRGGCSAKLYRYNASANSLSLVSNSSVRSNGSCTFDNVKQGGDYVIVLS